MGRSADLFKYERNLAASGVIPNGITTESGLITTMTFRAVATGHAIISISDASRVLANDGQGTAVQLALDRGNYTILPQAPAGPSVFSEDASIPRHLVQQQFSRACVEQGRWRDRIQLHDR